MRRQATRHSHNPRTIRRAGPAAPGPGPAHLAFWAPVIDPCVQTACSRGRRRHHALDRGFLEPYNALSCGGQARPRSTGRQPNGRPLHPARTYGPALETFSVPPQEQGQIPITVDEWRSERAFRPKGKYPRARLPRAHRLSVRGHHHERARNPGLPKPSESSRFQERITADPARFVRRHRAIPGDHAQPVPDDIISGAPGEERPRRLGARPEAPSGACRGREGRVGGARACARCAAAAWRTAAAIDWLTRPRK